MAATYQPLVYKTSGGDQLVVASGGVLELKSGATLSMTGIALTSTGGIAGSSGTFTADVAIGLVKETRPVARPEDLHYKKLKNTKKKPGRRSLTPTVRLTLSRRPT